MLNVNGNVKTLIAKTGILNRYKRFSEAILDQYSR
jgi:hypothetical protein